MARMIVAAFAAFLALVAPAPVASRVPGSVAGNVVILAPEDAQHRPLRILVDSGGYDLIESEAANRLGLPRLELDLGGKQREAVAFPTWSAPSLPAPPTRWLVARPGALRDGFAPRIDATFGPAWMIDHRITVDYPKRRIESNVFPRHATSVPVEIARGRSPAPSLPPTALVTIDASVGGKTLTFLLDTGATGLVRDSVRGAMPDDEPVHQICLIEASMLESWRREHPEWTYATSAFDVAGDADGAASPAILVPDLKIGTARALPTWFVARRDATTFAAVSKETRKTVVGDLGGDALRRWRVTFDLANERLLLD
jgi:hypothetical protein